MNATAVASRLIGDIFVDEGLITDEQLEQALDEQQTTGERLGEVLIARFGISRLELASALAEQLAEHERGAVDESATEGEPVDTGPLGRIFVESGTATEDQLEEALERQRETGQRLGEILVEQGLLSRVELTTALSEQLASLQTLHSSSSRPDQAPGSTLAADGEPELGGVVHDLRATFDRLQGSNKRAESTAAFSQPGQAPGSTSDADAEPATPRNDESPLAEVVNDLRATFDRLQDSNERAESTAGERMELVERRLADAVTPAQLDERVHSLTSGMMDLTRLIDELAGQLTLQKADAISTVDGVVDRVAELEQRLSAAATSAELDERLERALAAHATELSSGLDALTHDMKHVASAGDLNRLRRSVDLLSKATAGTDELAARRLEQLEAHTEEAAAGNERLQATLTETADRSRAADERLRESVVEVADRTERRLSVERAELQARLGEAIQKLQTADAENLSSLRGSIEELAVQLTEQRDRLEAQARTDVERLDGRIKQHEARAEEWAADAARTTELLELEMERLESELRVRLERHADRIDEQRRTLEEVRDAGEHALQAAAAKLTQRLADVEQHAVASTVGLKADLGHLGEKVAGHALEAAQESAAARAELDLLRSRLEHLTVRLEGHEHRTVEDTADAQKELDEVRLGIGALGDRLDVDGRATTRNLDAVRKNVVLLHSHVEQLAVRLDDEAVRATDALERALASLREEVGDRERQTLAELSETSLAETKDELAGLRLGLVESDQQRRQGDESLDARIEETRREVAMVLKKVNEDELTRRKGDDLLDTRIAGLEQQLASEAAKAGNAAVAGREALDKALAAVRLIELGLTDVALRSGANTAELQRDLRAELVKTADSQTLLQSQIEELSRSHEVRLAKAEKALQTSAFDELRAQLAALQSQVDEQALQACAQAEAGEQLRASFAEIGSKLFERQQTFQAADEELQSTFEKLGRTISEADEQVAQDGEQPDEEPAAGG